METQEEKKPKKAIQVLKKTGIVVQYVIVFLAILITSSIRWMFRTWTSLNMNELMFHLQSPVEGTDTGIIKSYIVSCLLVSVVLTAVLVFLYIKIKNRRRIVLGISLGCMICIAAVTIRYMWERLGITAYAKNQTTSSRFIEDNYVDPNSVSLTFPEKKRNLIYIFLESMENTYSSEEYGGAFPENTIPELTELSLENENFSGDQETLNGGVPLTGATWTVGAMFAQTSGLPLKIPIEGNSMDTQKEFFPGLTTLGDILDDAGYDQTLLIGSDGTFGGRKLYFEEHGNYDVMDYNYCEQNGLIPEGYRVFWGFEDKKLFDIAKDTLKEKAASDEPFNLTMLTVDTHFEDGYVCDECDDTFGENQYANVMACSSRGVAEFVKWVQSQDFYENTTIVISGDHLTMDSDFCEDVPDTYERKVFTTYINAPVQPTDTTKYREYSTFDQFPTTLAALGVSIEGNHLGLGTNLFSSEITLIEKYDKNVVDDELEKQSDFMDEMTKNIKQVKKEETSDNDDTTEETEQTEQTETQDQPLAEIEVTPYDYHKGYYTITVQNIVPDDVHTVRCAIWQEEDQSDLIWYEAEHESDNTYVVNSMARDFGYRPGEYQIHVYGVTDEGDPVLLGSSMGEIVK